MFVRAEDYVGKKVTHKGKVATIEDISVMPGPFGGKRTLMLRLNGILVPAAECYEYHDPVQAGCGLSE